MNCCRLFLVYWIMLGIGYILEIQPLATVKLDVGGCAGSIFATPIKNTNSDEEALKLFGFADQNIGLRHLSFTHKNLAHRSIPLGF